MLEDSSLGLVPIGTRHDSHGELAARALEAGKHVVLEKPAAIDRLGLARLEPAARGPGPAPRPGLQAPPLTLGFKRRHSPCARRLADLIADDPRPTLLYWVNAGGLPSGHWTQDPSIGGGRIVGEACHMVDLVSFLTRGAAIEDLQVAGDGAAERDGAVITIRCAGGALATILYSSRGGPGLPKERFEVFSQGRAFLLDDFRALHGAAPDLLLGEPDKGLTRQWEEIAAALAGKGHRLASLVEVLRTTEVTLLVDERLRGAPVELPTGDRRGT